MSGTEPDEAAELDLAELDIEGDVAGGQLVAAWVDRIRARLREGPLVVRNCPQMLAHTLYKAGVLRDSRLVLTDVREEEPYG